MSKNKSNAVEGQFVFRIMVGMLGLGLLFSSFARAADETVHIGFVDMQKAIQTSEPGKKARSGLEKEFNDKKKELQAEENNLKKMVEEFKKQSLALSEEARAKKQAEIQERAMKHQEIVSKYQMEIQNKEQDLTKPIVDKLRNVIATIAKDKGYTLIIEKNENTVLYSLEKDDLTAQVIEAYNKSK